MEETSMESNEWIKNDNRRYCYVVEGAADENKLKSLGFVFVVKTGGKYIRKDILDFLELVSEYRTLVIVTDPDKPGREIERRIRERVGFALSVHAEKEKAIYNGKVGIAEMTAEDLKALLKNYMRHDLFVDENFSLEDEDFYDLGLEGPGAKERRMILVNKYHIPYTSKKNVEDAMLMLGKTKYDIQEDLENE